MGAKESVCVENCSIEERKSRNDIARETVRRAMTNQLDALRMKHTVKELDLNSEDASKPLKAVATDFVVAEYFSTISSLYKFLSTIHDFYDLTLKHYREIRGLEDNQCLFLFKGGNILRIVAHEFLKTMPEQANFEISRYYEPFFKRSDNDFSILLDPDLEDYDAIFAEITTIAYILQDELRSLFAKDLVEYFDFARYTDTYKQRIYAKWLPKFNETGLGEFVGIRTSSAKDGTSRFKEDDYGNNRRQVVSAEIPSKISSPFVIKHNSALEFPNPKGERVSFNLTRTKVVFSLQQRGGKKDLEVRGELIDVSVPHRTDTNIGYFFEKLEDNVADYDLDMGSTSEPLRFKSLSLAYLIHDLEYILYEFNEVPWEDVKYGKRMNRLVYMYFIDMFIRTEVGSERLEILREVKSAITNGYAFKRKNLLFFRLTEKVKNLRKSHGKSEDFQEMVNLMEENMEFLINSLKSIREYCQTDGFVSQEEIYSGSTESLI